MFKMYAEPVSPNGGKGDIYIYIYIYTYDEPESPHEAECLRCMVNLDRETRGRV